MTIVSLEEFNSDTNQYVVYAIADPGDTIPSSGLVIDGLPTGASCAPSSTIEQPSENKVWRADSVKFNEVG